MHVGRAPSARWTRFRCPRPGGAYGRSQRYREIVFEVFHEAAQGDGPTGHGGSEATFVFMCNTAEGDGPTGHGGDEFQRGSFVYDSSGFTHDGDTDFIFIFGETLFGQFSETRAEAPR